MKLGFRNADSRTPFLWDSAAQPQARWHADGEGPAHYLADTPDGAWAEFIRHEEIAEPDDLLGVARALWAVQVDEGEIDSAPWLTLPDPPSVATYPRCQTAARDARAAGATAIGAPSAALAAGSAGGLRCESGGLVDGPPTDGEVWVLFGPRPNLSGWRCVREGRPPVEVLAKVRPLP